MQLINVNKQTKKTEVQLTNPNLSQYFLWCLMGALRSHDHFFEADNLILSKTLKTLNIRHLILREVSTRTCCPPLEQDEAIRCSNPLKLRCLIQESHPRMLAHRKCCRIVTHNLQHLHLPILRKGLILPWSGESRSENKYSLWIQKSCNCYNLPRAAVSSLEGKGGAGGTQCIAFLFICFSSSLKDKDLKG